jgi:hypothetical protein
VTVTQTDLFSAPVARFSDPSTSWEAATKASKGAASLRARCHEALIAAGARGLNDFELAEAVGSIQTSVGVRRGELVKAGLVVSAGKKRLSPHGSPSMVWVAV